MSAITIKHYSNTFQSDFPFHHMTDDFGESNTDKSFYRPDISSARALAGSAGGSTRVGKYDFEDGKDTGDTIQTVLRMKGLDITEIDTLQQRIIDNMNMKKKMDETAIAKKLSEMKEKTFNDYIKKISESDIVNGVVKSDS